MCVRIPGRDDLAGFNIAVLTSRHYCTIWQLIALTLTTISVVNDQLTGTGDNDQLPFYIFNGFHVAQVNRAGVLDLNAV